MTPSSALGDQLSFAALVTWFEDTVVRRFILGVYRAEPHPANPAMVARGSVTRFVHRRYCLAGLFEVSGFRLIHFSHNLVPPRRRPFYARNGQVSLSVRNLLSRRLELLPSGRKIGLALLDSIQIAGLDGLLPRSRRAYQVSEILLTHHGSIAAVSGRSLRQRS